MPWKRAPSCATGPHAEGLLSFSLTKDFSSNWVALQVTSSCLCKYAEGAVFPFQIESLEDGVDDSVHGLHVDEANHGPGSSTHFDEAAFNDVGGAQLAPQVLGKMVEDQQVGQIAFQLPHHGGIFPAPAAAEGARGSLGLTAAIGQIDGLGIQLDGIMVALAHLVEDIAHLVHPAALMGYAGIDGLDGGSQSGAAVGDDQQQLVALQSAPVEILKQRLPVSLTLTLGAQKAEQLPGAVPAHAVGHQHLHMLPSRRPAHLQRHAIQKQVSPFVPQGGSMKLPHRLIQITRQPRDGLGTDRLSAHGGYDPAYLPRGNAAQKGLADQQRQLRRPALKFFDCPGKKALAAGPRHAQPDGAKAGHKIPLVIAVAVLSWLARSPLVAVPNCILIAQPLRFRFQKSLPGKLRLLLQIAPEALLQIC